MYLRICVQADYSHRGHGQGGRTTSEPDRSRNQKAHGIQGHAHSVCHRHRDRPDDLYISHARRLAGPRCCSGTATLVPASWHQPSPLVPLPRQNARSTDVHAAIATRAVTDLRPGDFGAEGYVTGRDAPYSCSKNNSLSRSVTPIIPTRSFPDTAARGTSPPTHRSQSLAASSHQASVATGARSIGLGERSFSIQRSTISIDSWYFAEGSALRFSVPEEWRKWAACESFGRFPPSSIGSRPPGSRPGW